MVGERYRDVIGAADAILQMQERTNEMGELFAQIDARCDVAALKLAVNAQTATNRNVAAEESKKRMFTIAAQIRLLVMTPEQIWISMEHDQYLAAAHLYLVSRLVFRGLQTSMQPGAPKVTTSFPVVQRQWDAISPFRLQIVEKATHCLGKLDHSDKSLSETLGAIAMLDSLTPKALLDVLLKERSSMIETDFKNAEKALSSTNLTPESRADAVADKIIGFVDMIHKTLVTIGHLFVAPESAQSQIEVFLQSLQHDPRSDSQGSSADSERLVSSLYSEKANMHIIFRHLPQSIQHYSPVLNLGKSNISSALTNSDVQTVTRAWLSGVIAVVNGAAHKLLESVVSGVLLARIRKSVLVHIHHIEFGDPDAVIDSNTLAVGLSVGVTKDESHKSEWKSLAADTLSQPDFSLWKDVCQPFMLEKSIQLIQHAFEPLAKQPHVELARSLANLSLGSHVDRDVSRFVWGSASEATDATTISHENLQALCRMQTPDLMQLGSAFEDAAMVIREDLLPLIGETYSEVANSIKTARSGMLSSTQPTQMRRSSIIMQTCVAESKLGQFNLAPDTKILSSALIEAFLKA
eukprot:jgi/Hompol1/5347/HPOL_004355-RA